MLWSYWTTNEYQKDSQESRKSLEKPVESEISIEEKKAQDSYSEFSEDSQNSQDGIGS